MPSADILIAITQISVALAGFSGLIAAIRTTAPEGWHPRDIWSLTWMLGSSIGALMLAFLPLWLALFGGSDQAIFQTSSVFAFFYTGILVCVMTWTGRRLTKKGYPPRVPFFPTAIAFLLGVPTVLAGVVALGWLADWAVPIYVGTLLVLLVASSLVLAVFLIILARSAQQPW
jgi:peptidoglycan/LPS O-acetylase OafA/YrhL